MRNIKSEQELELMEIQNLSNESDDVKVQKSKDTLPTKLSYKDQRALESLPAAIEVLEAEIKSIQKCLENPECYQRIGLTALSQDLESKEASLEEMIEALLDIEEKLEMMQKG